MTAAMKLHAGHRLSVSLKQVGGRLRKLGEGLFEFCASLRLAVFVAIALIAALATGSAVEARAGAAVARAHVYQSPIFLALLALLALNVMAAALIRFPWTRWQMGMVITHVGIELLLAGALIGSRYGLDGEMRLSKGQSVSNIQLGDDRLIVGEPAADGSPTGYEFDLRLWSACDWSGRWPSGHRAALPRAGDAEFTILDWRSGADAKQPRTLVLGMDLDGKHYEQAIAQNGTAEIATPRGPVRLAYGPQEHDLPFEVALLDSQTKTGAPGDTAESTVHLGFTAEDGAVSFQTVRINQPATFRGVSIYAGSVDAVDANNPSVSLSVRSDPGRWLKVSGSALIVAGTFSLFAYRRSVRRGRASALRATEWVAGVGTPTGVSPSNTTASSTSPCHPIQVAEIA